MLSGGVIYLMQIYPGREIARGTRTFYTPYIGVIKASDGVLGKELTMKRRKMKCYCEDFQYAVETGHFSEKSCNIV
jgi:hypothetical protein